jgi:hypothetical protein
MKSDFVTEKSFKNSSKKNSGMKLKETSQHTLKLVSDSSFVIIERELQ